MLAWHSKLHAVSLSPGRYSKIRRRRLRTGLACAIIRSPMTLEQRTLLRAQRLLGSPASLARILLVPLPTLQAWLEGEGPVPLTAFMRAVDVVNDGGRSLDF